MCPILLLTVYGNAFNLWSLMCVKMSSSLSAIQLKKTQAPPAAVENETSPVLQMLNDGPNPDQTCSQVKVLSNTSSMLTCMWLCPITKVDQCLCGFILAVKAR